MGRSRTCGKVCHEAKQAKCECWCGGLFHGAAGEAARQAFAQVVGELPGGEEQGTLFWNKGIEAARAAGKESKS